MLPGNLRRGGGAATAAASAPVRPVILLWRRVAQHTPPKNRPIPLFKSTEMMGILFLGDVSYKQVVRAVRPLQNLNSLKILIPDFATPHSMLAWHAFFKL